MNKLQTLCEIEGFADELELGEAFVADSVCPGICMNPGCDYTTEVEPDQTRGWCEICGTNTVKSGFILMGII
jgi:hypothetical protein